MLEVVLRKACGIQFGEFALLLNDHSSLVIVIAIKNGDKVSWVFFFFSNRGMWFEDQIYLKTIEKE